MSYLTGAVGPARSNVAHRFPRWQLAIAACVAAAAACFIISGVFEWRKHQRSGVPIDHFAVQEDARFFYVPRGRGPLAMRPQIPLTQRQYLDWYRNDRMAAWIGFPGVLLIFLAVGIYCYQRPPWKGAAQEHSK